MVLSEAEAEAQLVDLRRQREALDRAIADLSLYLELGRRLTSVAAMPAETSQAPDAPFGITKPAASPSRSSVEPARDQDRVGARASAPFDRDHFADHLSPLSAEEAANAASAGYETRRASPAARGPEQRDESQKNPSQSNAAAPAPMDGALSDGVLARRYGRALIEAALAALDEAGRPLHAGEILAVLTSRGFSLPGHDPVAALNTRLWKRSGPGGPIKRMGDAVYALVEPQDAVLARGRGTGEDEG